MTAFKRTGLLAAAILLVAGTVVAPSLRAASPSDPAGAPFVIQAQALAQGDYPLACAQFSTAGLRRITGLSSVTKSRALCVKSYNSGADELDTARFASTRVVAVRITPGRARVTIQTTFHDLEPRETGTAVVEDGAWKILDRPDHAHVGSLYLYTIPSSSMLPTLKVGDTVLVDHTAYRHAKPSIGDIVVFHPPAGALADECGRRPPKRQACAVATAKTAMVNFIKRIVAGPGDRIAIRAGHLIRNGKRADEPFTAPCKGAYAGCDFPRTFTVASGSYYVLGDERGASDDSRFWGPVARSALVGRVTRVIPPDPQP